MSLYDELIAAVPSLTDVDFAPNGEAAVWLKDDGDGIVYIAKWEHSEPLPKGFKIGK